MFSLFQVQILCMHWAVWQGGVALSSTHRMKSFLQLGPLHFVSAANRNLLCSWGKEEFSPGDAPCWSQLHHCPAAAEEGFMALPPAISPVSLQSSHPQILHILVSPLPVPFPLFWCLCSSRAQHGVSCPQGGWTQFCVHLPNSRESCSVCTSPSAIPARQVGPEAGYWQWYQQWATLHNLHVI